jgi:predicted RNase H-like HicB family nuclease
VQKTIEEYMRMPWKTNLRIDTFEGKTLYIASNPELFSCLGQGSTPDEAVNSLNEARRMLLQFMLEDGDKIPEPTIEEAQMSLAPTYIFLAELPYTLTNLQVFVGGQAVAGAEVSQKSEPSETPSVVQDSICP